MLEFIYDFICGIQFSGQKTKQYLCVYVSKSLCEVYSMHSDTFLIFFLSYFSSQAFGLVYLNYFKIEYQVGNIQC